MPRLDKMRTILGGSVIAAAAFSGTLAFTALPASAGSYGPTNGNNGSPPASPNTGDGSQTAAAPATTTSGGGLAFTGADVALATGIGAGAIGLGGVMVLISRRRQQPS